MAETEKGEFEIIPPGRAPSERHEQPEIPATGSIFPLLRLYKVRRIMSSYVDVMRIRNEAERINTEYKKLIIANMLATDDIGRIDEIIAAHREDWRRERILKQDRFELERDQIRRQRDFEERKNQDDMELMDMNSTRRDLEREELRLKQVGYDNVRREEVDKIVNQHVNKNKFDSVEDNINRAYDAYYYYALNKFGNEDNFSEDVRKILNHLRAEQRELQEYRKDYPDAE